MNIIQFLFLASVRQKFMCLLETERETQEFPLTLKVFFILLHLVFDYIRLIKVTVHTEMKIIYLMTIYSYNHVTLQR